jgi:hypothetical protein
VIEFGHRLATDTDLRWGGASFRVGRISGIGGSFGMVMVTRQRSTILLGVVVFQSEPTPGQEAQVENGFREDWGRIRRQLGVQIEGK